MGDRHLDRPWTTGSPAPQLSSGKALDNWHKDQFKSNYVLALDLNQGFATELGSQECPEAQHATENTSGTSLLLPHMNSFRRRDIHASLRRFEMIDGSSQGEYDTWKSSHSAWGNLLHASHSTLQLLSPKKGSLRVFNLEGYFLCRNKSLDFTSSLGINPIQQAASPGPRLMCSVEGCSHQEGSSGAARSPD